jgi:hypothetical protein
VSIYPLQEMKSGAATREGEVAAPQPAAATAGTEAAEKAKTPETVHAWSVWLGSERLAITGKVDFVEAQGDVAIGGAWGGMRFPGHNRPGLIEAGCKVIRFAYNPSSRARPIRKGVVLIRGRPAVVRVWWIKTGGGHEGQQRR